MSKLQEWKDRADKMALSLKMDIAVVDNGGSFQLWPVSKCGSGVYIAEYGGSENAD